MSRPLHVLHIHSGNLYGGVETMLLTMARHEAAAGMKSSFALCFDARFAEELSAAGAQVHLLGNARVSRPWSILRVRRRLATLTRKARPEIAVFHSGWSQAIFGVTTRSTRLPVVRWLHAPLDPHLWLERWARRTRTSLVICNSRFTAASIERADPTAQRAVLFPPVAAPDPAAAGARSQLRATLGADQDSTVIALVGRMEAWKGHDVLIHALASVADRRDWHAWIIGGPQRPDEVSYLGKLGLAAARLGLGERVKFLGERTDVRALLAAADLYCQPNTAPEPFGITFVEALYAGLPVVTFDLGGPAEIVDASCGVLVRPGDLRELCIVLRRLIGDPAERRRLAQHAPERARALCDPSIQVPRIAERLRTVL